MSDAIYYYSYCECNVNLSLVGIYTVCWKYELCTIVFEQYIITNTKCCSNRHYLIDDDDKDDDDVYLDQGDIYTTRFYQ